ncbi:MAG TPA: ribulose-phosphate 3-epimerase, partial [Thermoplasmata archaeon]|nr:ribulose-phosphate 3-epimerase [Thermoplasmata archaeon]
ALDKLRRARKLIDEVEKETGKKVLLEIDGGVNLHNIDEIVKCGVDIIVAGSAVFKGNAEKNLKQLQSHCE